MESSLVTLIEPGENNLCRVCIFVAADMMHAKHTDRTNASRAEHVCIVIDGPSYLAQAYV